MLRSVEIKHIKGKTFCIDTGMTYIPFYKIDNENIIMFSVIDDKKQCTVRKRLYLQNDGHIGVEEDVTINFVVHDVNTKNAYV